MCEIDNNIIEYFINKKINNKLIIKKIDIEIDDDIKFNINDINENLKIKVLKSN